MKRSKIVCACKRRHLCFSGSTARPFALFLFRVLNEECCREIAYSLIKGNPDWRMQPFSNVDDGQGYYAGLFIRACKYQSLYVINTMWNKLVCGYLSQFTRTMAEHLIHRGIETACTFYNPDALKFFKSTPYYDEVSRHEALIFILIPVHLNVQKVLPRITQLLEYLLTTSTKQRMPPLTNINTLLVKSPTFKYIYSFLFNKLHMTFLNIDESSLTVENEYTLLFRRDNDRIMKNCIPRRNILFTKMHAIISVFTCRDVALFTGRFVGLSA